MTTINATHKTLLQENWQYLRVLMVLAVLSIALVFGVQLAEGIPLELDVNNRIFTLSLLFIPLFAVNIIYYLKTNFIEYCRNPRQVILLKTVGMYVGIISGTVLFEWIYGLYGIIDNDYIVLGPLELSPSVSEVISNAITATIIGIPIFIRQGIKDKANKEIKAKERELEKAHQLNVQSQLEALQARVNPHFLYNSLNSIASLIHINPDQAEQMVLSLSELFRYSLNYSDGQLSTIAKEVKMVETYLGIEMIRFGDQLTCEIDVEPGLEKVLIPRFLLQPIVENAIKHGTSKIKKGSIRLSIARSGNDLEFKVADNGPDFPELFNSGYGLKSVTDQLQLIYEDNHSFELLNSPEKHVRIVLKNVLSNE